jgi:hypothetical protein
MVMTGGQYSRTILDRQPVGYWRLGEKAPPTAADASGSGCDGTYVGNPALGQPGSLLNDPDTGVGLGGPGARDYVEVPDPISQSFSQPTSGLGLTLEVWIRPDVLTFAGETEERYIHWLGKGGPRQCEWGLRFYSNDSPSRPNRISAYVWNPDGGEGAGAYFQDTLVPGSWIHVVAVFEPGDRDTDPPAGVHIYRDGVHRLGPPSPGTLYRTFGVVPRRGTLPLRLGTRDAAASGSAAASYLTGGLDEVAIYPRALTPDEIRENYVVAHDETTSASRDTP